MGNDCTILVHTRGGPHSSCLGVVEPQDEGHNAGLAAAGLTAESDGAPGLHREVDVLEHQDLGALRVGEPHPTQLNLARHFLHPLTCVNGGCGHKLMMQRGSVNLHDRRESM